MTIPVSWIALHQKSTLSFDARALAVMIVDQSRSVERRAFCEGCALRRSSASSLSLVRSISLREPKQYLSVGRLVDVGALRKV